MNLEQIALIDEANRVLNDVPDLPFYNMCNNHIKTREFCNNVPMMRLDVRSATWNIETSDDWKEHESINQMLCENFEWLCEDIKETEGIEIFTDLNGYRVLLGSDIYNNFVEINEKIEDMKSLQSYLSKAIKEESEGEIQDYEDELENIEEELKDLIEYLKEESQNVKKFLKLEKRIQNWIDSFPEDYKARKKEMELEAEPVKK